ncbi:MAG: hypothetical protein R3B84_23910 [Zavarzinella sp.]
MRKFALSAFLLVIYVVSGAAQDNPNDLRPGLKEGAFNIPQSDQPAEPEKPTYAGAILFSLALTGGALAIVCTPSRKHQ